MPESPEVQTFVDVLYERAVERHIRSLEITDYRSLKTREPAVDVLDGCLVSAVLRFGKYVDIDAGSWHLVVSFGRHGWAVFSGADGDEVATPAPDAPAVVGRLRFDDGSGFDLTDAGQFRSAALYLVSDPTDVPGIMKLGLDPADPTYTRGDFERAVDGRRKQLKALLQEQDSFAGIGNAYSDEILYAARLSPTVHAADLDESQRDRLFTATREVIRAAIDDRRGIPIADLKAAKIAAMRVHGRTGQPCPDCGGTIENIGRDDASGQWCPQCQAA